MTWQDWALTTAAWVMNIALFPALKAQSKPPIATGILTASCLLTIGLTYLSLNLLASSLTVLIGALMWSILTIQAIKKKRGLP